MMPLAGHVAVVTGAGRGVGACIATLLAREGAAIVLNDLDTAPAEATADAVRATGGQALVVAGDVTGEGFADRLATAALARFGGIDILINNAGYVWNARIEATTDAQWQAMLDVHLTAPFRLIRRVTQHWQLAGPAPGRRRIVNVSSISGTHGAVGQIGYSAAKAGLVGLTRSLARELGPDGVTVNAVAFGFVETRLTQEVHGETTIEVAGARHRVGLTARARADVQARTPLRRAATPDEAAGGVVLLCRPESSFITGQVIEVDGGYAI